MNNIVGIYKITCLITNKVYVGQTVDFNQRWSKYYNLNCKSQVRIYNSLKKYKVENHVFEIIEECLVEELDQKEEYYKQYFIDNIGWDMVLFCQLKDGKGGYKSEITKQKMRKPKPNGFGFGKKHSDKTKQKMSEKRYSEEQKLKMRKPKITSKKGKEHGLFGKPKSKEHIKNIRQSILQYDLQGNFIKEWNSVLEANVFLGKTTNASSISLCLVGKYKKAFGYIWKYKFSNEIPNKTKIKFNYIVQLDKTGNIINEFINPTVAQKETGINSGSIWYCLNGKTKTSGGYIWKYKENLAL
jgi:group I intron endonuclease